MSKRELSKQQIRQRYGGDDPSNADLNEESFQENFSEQNGYEDGATEHQPSQQSANGEFADAVASDLPNALDQEGVVTFMASVQVQRTWEGWDNNKEPVVIHLDAPRNFLSWNATLLDVAQSEDVDQRLDTSKFVVWKIILSSVYNSLQQPVAISFEDETMRHANKVQGAGGRAFAYIIPPGKSHQSITICDKSDLINSKTYARALEAPDAKELQNQFRVLTFRDNRPPQPQVLAGSYLHEAIVDMKMPISQPTTEYPHWLNAPFDSVNPALSITSQFKSSVMTTDVNKPQKIAFASPGRQGNGNIPLGTGNDEYLSQKEAYQEDMRQTRISTVGFTLTYHGAFDWKEPPTTAADPR